MSATASRGDGETCYFTNIDETTRYDKQNSGGGLRKVYYYYYHHAEYERYIRAAGAMNRRA